MSKPKPASKTKSKLKSKSAPAPKAKAKVAPKAKAKAKVAPKAKTAPKTKAKTAPKAKAKTAPKAKAKTAPKAKAKVAPKAKTAPKTKAKRNLTENALGELEQLLGPTLRAYAEEEASILQRASQHPKLGARFVEEMAQSDAAIPKKYRAPFHEAMAGVNVAARATAVVKRMEKYWGRRLDAETKESIRADVAAMYRGDASPE
ncbi:MAG: hypothetical protein J0I07_39415 [Myxococcales bacterium]|nr:hypothetical protein [Myxococcales bacterium]